MILKWRTSERLLTRPPASEFLQTLDNNTSETLVAEVIWDPLCRLRILSGVSIVNRSNAEQQPRRPVLWHQNHVRMVDACLTE